MNPIENDSFHIIVRNSLLGISGEMHSLHEYANFGLICVENSFPQLNLEEKFIIKFRGKGNLLSKFAFRDPISVRRE